MTAADDHILEFLLNEGNEPLAATPAMVEMNIDYKITHVRTRLRELQSAGLVEYFDENRGAYQITERGRDYLDGKLDVEDLEE
ncbi:winged helix-turn-helix domain-containing protein [Halobacteria archaeon HArc-gm2]|nr:winged helix-turn-helix domain-containing protein [Halobacteria archaeon HArc-gm2]